MAGKKKDTAIEVSKGNSLGSNLSNVLTKEQKELIKRNFAKHATDDELTIYFNFCGKAGVDPLRGQAHFIKYKPGEKPIMMIGIDGFQARATEDARYNGMVANAVYENDDFSMNPVEGTIAHSFGVKSRGKLIGAYAILKRKGMVNAVQWINFDEYKRNTQIWRDKPEVMITKVARATLLRREYPDNFSGIYTPEEFSGEITEKGDFIDHSKEIKKATRVVRVAQEEPDKAVKQEADIQDVEFEDVETGIPLPDDLINSDMTPREALEEIMEYAMMKDLGKDIRPVIVNHYAPYGDGSRYPYHIPEPNVIAIVKELTGIKLKRAEKNKTCKNKTCKNKVTEPEAEEQDGLCFDCFKEQQEDDD